MCVHMLYAHLLCECTCMGVHITSPGSSSNLVKDVMFAEEVSGGPQVYHGKFKTKSYENMYMYSCRAGNQFRSTVNSKSPVVSI